MHALPFVLVRSDDVVAGTAVTSTTERIHGLLRIDGDQFVIQWRLARETDHVGPVIRSEHEVEPVREVTIPLSGLAGAVVRRRSWWRPWRRPEIILTASDLRAFEAITGAAGLKLDHPAAFALPVQRSQSLVALEFAAELNLILAEREQRRSPTARHLGSRETPRLPDSDG